jgi:hypothetical protein
MCSREGEELVLRYTQIAVANLRVMVPAVVEEEVLSRH